MSFKEIRNEIATFIARKVDSNETVELDIVVRDVIVGKPSIDGDDAEFYRVCTYQKVAEIAKQCIGKYNARDQPSRQLALPGFEHLQVAYTVERNGAVTVVPINLMTDEELNARAAEYDAMAKGCRDHAREIRGYITKRAAANDNHESMEEAA